MRGVVGAPRYGGMFDGEEAGALAFVLPGEIVETGAPLAVLQPDAARVMPGCVHFGRCGGCQYQHGAYEAQLAWKSSILQGLAQEAKLAPMPEPGVLAGEPWGYRNRIRLRLGRDAGGLRVGYRRRGTNEFLPVSMCPIAASVLWRVAETVVRLAGEDVGFGRWIAAVEEMEIFCSGDEQRVQIQFLLAEAGPEQRRKGSFAAMCERLKALVPELAGAGASLDPELGRRARRSWEGAAWGAPGLRYEVGGRAYWVSRGAFFQVNRFLLERFVELVRGAAEGELAWDLFAGVGLFSQPLAERFKRVIAVEGGEIAAADLLAASHGGKDRAGFVARRMATLDFLREQEHQRERPGLVVLDPPRAGLGAEAAGVLARIGAARVVYVSCDPGTLMRDVAVLARGGYRVERVTMVDLFPQTFHVETVVELGLG